jgi:hypothetical protein
MILILFSGYTQAVTASIEVGRSISNTTIDAVENSNKEGKKD